jgi:hypothetical protein
MTLSMLYWLLVIRIMQISVIFGKQLDLWLTKNHAQALFPMICVDQLNHRLTDV